LAIAGGELNRRHQELYTWFQKHQHRFRPGNLDATTLLLIHFLATEGAVEEAPPPPKANSKGKQAKPEKKGGMRSASTKPAPGEQADDEPPESPEHSYEEQGAVDFKAVKKGTPVWVLAENGTLDGEYAGPGRNGKVYVKIAGKRESVDPEAVRIAIAN
jgi:hypothetical protein